MFRKILLLSVIVLSVSILLISAQSGDNVVDLYDQNARLMSAFVNRPFSVQFKAMRADLIHLYILNVLQETCRSKTLIVQMGYKLSNNIEVNANNI